MTLMDMYDNSALLFDDLISGHEDDEFLSGGGGCYSDSLRMAFTDSVLSCSPYRHPDSPSLAKDCLPVTMHLDSLSNQCYDEDMSLPLLDDFRLDEREAASKFVGPSSHSGWRGRLGGKRGSADKGKPGKCKVCGDLATGMYFGALVCVPCKTFFLRYEGDNFNFVCKGNKNCEITMATRTQCKFCRYQKCREAGMVRRVRPAHVNLNEGQQLCVVCHDVANGIHFGAVTCEGCKKFFRRGLSEHAQYSCKNGQICVINPRTRNSCRFCRYKKCLSVGMSREAIQMGRPSKLAMETSGIQRGMRPTTGNSGIARTDKNRQLETPMESAQEIAPHYLVGNGHPKEEPPTWDWPNAGNFAGHAVGVCDFLTSPAKHVGMEAYGTPHPGGGILTPLCGSNGGDQTLSGGCLSRMSNVSPESIHYGNARWNDMNIDVAKRGAAEPVGLSALHHNGGGSIHQMNVSSYEPCRAGGGQGLVPGHILPEIYHGKANIPLTVNGVVSSDVFQLPSNAVGVCQPPKFGHLESSPQSKLECFDLPRSLKAQPDDHKIGQIEHYSNVLESLLDDSCQAQEQIGSCNRQEEHFSMKYDSGVNFLGITSNPQSIASKSKPNPETSNRGAFENIRPTTSVGNVQFETIRSSQSEKTNGTSSFQTASESPSSTTVGLQSQQDQTEYLRFDASTSTEATGTSKATMATCAAPQRGLESNVLPNSTGCTRDDAVVPMITMSDETKHNMDSIANWVFQLQQNYVYNNEEEAPTVSLSSDLIKVCRDLDVDGVPFEQQIERSIQYWKSQELPDENIMVGAEHWRLFNHFHPLYANYVSVGSTWNHNLRIKYEQWKECNKSATIDETMTWVKDNVFPAYTDLSRGYFTQIQGFKSFDVNDQQILLRLAQSQSRVLAAALAWFNSDSQIFTDFLPWRELKPGQVDLFKELLTDYAKKMQNRNLDPVESALFNIVVVIATDYPGLVSPDIIERYRTQFLATFRAYTTAKYGTPNKRMEKLFQLVPQLRRLGHLHYAMTRDPNIGITTISTNEEI